jgi:hypothetical protein
MVIGLSRTTQSACEARPADYNCQARDRVGGRAGRAAEGVADPGDQFAPQQSPAQFPKDKGVPIIVNGP